jgi:hypothetical protein
MVFDHQLSLIFQEGKAQLGEPTVNQVISGGRRKLHYLYPDNTEMVEEFDINSNECLLRKWKKPREFGEATW